MSSRALRFPPAATLSNSPRNIIQLPVQNFMPAQGEAFEITAPQAGAPAGGVPLPAVGTTAIVVSFTVPNGRNGFIRRIANVVVGGGFTDFSGGAVWQIILDLRDPTFLLGVNVVAPHFDNITASLGSASNPSTFDGLRIQEKQLVALVVKNVSIPVAGQIVGGRLGGSFYPIPLEPPNMVY
jgi:hypothetical protein